jgi:tetratricopeptide (TPR) repeat protein
MQPKETSRTLKDWLQIAQKELQEGRFLEAERSLEEALKLDPQHPDALHLLGIATSRLGKNARALELIGRAKELRPDIAQFDASLGLVNIGLRRFHDALVNFEDALRKRADDADALVNRGIALYELTRPEEALSSYDKALAVRGDSPEAWHNRGVVLQSLKRHEEALSSYDKALAIRRDSPEAWHDRGVVLQSLKRYEDALSSYDKALAIRRDSPEAWHDRGIVLQSLKRYEEALSSYDKGLGIKRDSAEGWNNRGSILHDLRRYEEAVASYDEALKLAPRSADAWGNRGLALHELRRYEEALANFDSAIATNPSIPRIFLNRGATLLELGRYRDALAGAESALALDPQFADAHLSASLCRLLLGDFERGWAEYEWRGRLAEYRFLDLAQPRWQGKEDLTGKKIVLYGEQGFGDTLQFARYAQAVSKKGAKVILWVQPPLKSLLSTISNVQVLSQKQPFPPCDYQCPLGSLPLAFNTRLDTIPAPVAYLTAPASAIKKWERIFGPGNQPKVGIVWSGGTVTRHDFKRSIPLAELLALEEVPVELVSLQKEVRADDERVLKTHDEIVHFGAKLEDFSDTAAVVSLMDLVITVDTSVAHLAGAMGKPVWVLLPFSPDWRWRLNRADSPWYPTARLFRQPSIGDWKSVVEDVKRNLNEFVNQARGAASTLRSVDADGAANEAKIQIEAGRFRDAQLLLSKAASDHPRSAQLQYLLGVSIHEQGNIERAIACYRKALKLDSGLADAHKRLGRAHMEKRKYSQALACYREATQINPNDDVAIKGAAYALREMGEFGAARKLLQRALWIQVRDAFGGPWRTLRRLF